MPRKVCCVEQRTGAGWYCPLSDLVRVRDEPAQRWDGDEELLLPPDNLRELDNMPDARHARLLARVPRRPARPVTAMRVSRGLWLSSSMR